MQAEPFRPRELLRVLVAQDVDFVVVGGVAAAARGSAYVTRDLDIVYARDRINAQRLAAALSDVGASVDEAALAKGSWLTVQTNHGVLDLQSRPDGCPPFDELQRRAGAPLNVGGTLVSFASIDDLIAMGEAAARPKDILVASELRLLSDELNRRDTP
jgi:hypothetical protein